jgi:hypothetical protein
MYDLITTALLFVLLTPGVLLNIPSSNHGDIVTALVHALVFWVVLRFLTAYIPWWMVWLAGLGVIGYKFSSGGNSQGLM